MARRVVITGIGVVSPIGAGREAFWDGLFRGRTGFQPVTLFDTSPFRVHVAGEITDFDALPYLGKKGLRDLDRSTRLLCSAAKLAMDDSGLSITDGNSRSAGVAVGSTFGSLHSISQFDRSGLIEGPRFVNPSHFPNTVINSPASQVSIRFGIKGFNTTISTGFCASLDSISYAVDFIRSGRADAVLAGGVEELCEETFRMFYALNQLSGQDGSEPLCCPFDARRNGIMLAEGAAVLVLEEEEHARNRGAHIFAFVAGCGNCFDPAADHTFAGAGRGLRSSVAQALREAALQPGDIDHICASANSTPGLDRMEARIITEVFGPNNGAVPVSAVKSMIGETYSASGAFAVAAAVGAIFHGRVPPTMNHLERDTVCDLDCVPNEARAHRVRNALVTASDPYGQNAAIALEEYE